MKFNTEWDDLPKFVIADSPDRTFVIHLHWPRFVGEVIEEESNEGSIENPLWIDEPDLTVSEIASLMREAGDFYVQEMERE